MNHRFRVDAIEPYRLGQFAEAVRRSVASGQEIIDLSRFNPRSGAPAVAVETLIQASLKDTNHRYSSSQGILRLREAACRWYERNFNVSVCPETQTVITMGTKEGMGHLLLGLLSNQDQVLLPAPYYPVHAAAIVLAGGSVVPVSLCHSGEEEFPLELTENSESIFARLQQACTRPGSKPRALVFSFPHNPTTSVMTRGFIERLVQFVRENEILLVHDFAYALLSYDQLQAPSLLQVPGAFEVGIEFFSLSKSFSMPGFRVGFAIGNEKLIAALKKVKSYLDFGIFQPVQLAAVKALLEGDDFRRELLSGYQARRDLLVDGLTASGWKVKTPRATVFLWAAVPESYRDMGSMAFSQQVLERTGVALAPGVGFGEEGEGYVRFSFAESETRLHSALRLLGKFLLLPGFLLGGLLLDGISPRLGYAAECSQAMIELKRGVLLNNGSREEEASYRKAISFCDSLPEAHYSLGVNLTKQGRYDDASAELKRALELKRDETFAIAYAAVLEKKGTLDQAEAEYKKIIEHDQFHGLALSGLASIYLKQDKLLEAEEVLRQAIQVEPTIGSHFFNLGVVLERLDRKDEALTSFRTATERETDNGDYGLALGRAYLRAGQLDQAEEILQRVTIISPKNATALRMLGVTFERMKKYDKARDAFQRAIGLDPSKKGEVLVDLGIVFVRMKEYDQAIAQFEEALKINPQSAAAYSALGWAYLAHKDFNNAERVLIQARELNNKDAFVQNNLGVLYEQNGKKEKAREAFRIAVDLDANLAEARENLKRLSE